MALRTEQKLPIILFIVFLTLTTIGIVFYQSTTSLQQAIVWERQTNEFLALVDETAALGSNLDPSVFGFIITGNDTYLEPYNSAAQKAPRNIALLRQLAAGQPQTLEEIDRLDQILKETLDEAKRKVEYRKINGPNSFDQITNVMDRPRIQQLQASILRLKGIETQQLQEREAGLDKDLSRTVWILIVSSVAGILALGLANFVVYREIRKRQSAEVALTDANRGLEKRIDNRTAELQEVNERLLDIGSQRELALNNEKRARHEAEIANRLRDEFMATVSHELRTPLNSILGWARLLKDGSLNDGQSERAVTTIIKNSETQNRLIEDLLDVARLISGKLELEHEPVDIDEALHDSIESARPAADGKHITIHLEQSDTVQPKIVSGDRNRLRQVFSNLLTNAIKFSSESSKISATASSADGVAIIEVKDEGVGISAEFLPMVFERFRQDTSSPGRNGGLGLGLAIVRNLVEMHGGSVSVESKGENKGATFTVRLPLIQN
ncbi:MAG TPA: ATP-binding protein [Pyrinomonadaceae bacterium]|nr:ATP-binding protein [Pyrinomonadaceae bacterium]